MKFEIRSDIPIPEPLRGVAKYPFDELEVGQSFFVPNASGSKLHSAAIRCKPKKFTVRRVNENGVWGARMWRVA